MRKLSTSSLALVLCVGLAACDEDGSTWGLDITTDQPTDPGTDTGTDLKVMKDQDVTIQIKAPDGHLVKEMRRTSDPMGTMNGAFELSPDAPLGRYTLRVKGAHSSDTATNAGCESMRAAAA